MTGLRASLLPFFALLSLSACGGTTSSANSGTGGGTTTTTTASTTSTTMATGDGGTGGQAPTGPVTAPSEQWTWIDFPDAFCADGSPTGIGVNLSSKSTRAIIYLEGGGACWSDLTCYSLKTASYFTSGYNASTFATESTDPKYLAEPGGFFDRTAAANPFKDYSYVYVPYCTGDIHAGDNIFQYTGHTAHHVGFANMTAYLKRLVPTFAGADRVFISGSSAGGFGAAYNWWQAQEAFGNVRVDLIDDSGTPMPADIPVQYEAQEQMAWNLKATLPPGCTGCDTNLAAIMGFYAQKFPDHRATLLSYVQDSTLPMYFGISTAQFTMGLDELLATYFPAGSNFQYFTNPGAGHVLWFSPTLTTTTTAGPVTVQQFITQMVTDDKSWTSVH